MNPTEKGFQIATTYLVSESQKKNTKHFPRTVLKKKKYYLQQHLQKC